MKKSQTQIFICFTVFHLLLTFLLINAKQLKHVKLILTPNLKSILLKIKELFPRVEIIYIDDLALENEFKKKMLRNFINLNNCLVKTCENYYRILNSNSYDFNNAEINMFLGTKTIERFFVLKYPNNFVRIIEDGFQTYNNVKLSKIKKLIYLFEKFPFNIGISRKVDEFIVQYPNKLPINCGGKKSCLNLSGLYSALDDNYKSRCLGVFLTSEQISILKEIFAKCDVILFTQPLSEDRLINESRKIELYERILNENTTTGDRIVIRPHPREKTDYHEVMNGKYKIMDGKFPIELINILALNQKVNKGITFFSSSLKNINIFKESITLGLNYDEGFAKIYKEKRDIK